MAINQLTTANTFQQWLVATQSLISIANNITDGIGGTFYANTNVVISGDLTVSGNITLDEIGFDDLKVNGSATIQNTLSVVGQTTLSTASITNADVTTLSGSANTQIYNTISASANGIVDTALAFAIALS